MLNKRMMGSVTPTDFPGTGLSKPKYTPMMIAMKTHSSIRNLPCVTR